MRKSIITVMYISAVFFMAACNQNKTEALPVVDSIAVEAADTVAVDTTVGVVEQVNNEPKTCPDCDGKGKVTCKKCKGEGCFVLGEMDLTTEACTACGGRGAFDHDDGRDDSYRDGTGKVKCKKCKGKGVIE